MDYTDYDDTEVQEASIKCGNCEEYADALVDLEKDDILRISCSHCGYVEERG